MGVVQIDGQLFDSPKEGTLGYLDGIVQSDTRSAILEFAGLKMDYSVNNASIRRVTQLKHTAESAPLHLLRYYKIVNGGPAVTTSMHFEFVNNDRFDETNYIPPPWIIWGDGRYWRDNPQRNSPLKANVTIPAGESVWLGVQDNRNFTTFYAKIYLQGAYDIHLQDPGHPDKEKMVTNLRYSPRSYPPKNKQTGDCWITLVSPYKDERFSGYSDQNDLPEDIVDWVCLRFRPGNSPPEKNCDMILGNG